MHKDVYMARLPRFCLAGIPQHVIQRGNNRQPCFAGASDYRFYLECMRAASRRYACAVHAYVLMTNHVHLLVTPSQKDVLPRFMQHIGRRYVQYFNFCYQAGLRGQSPFISKFGVSGKPGAVQTS